MARESMHLGLFVTLIAVVYGLVWSIFALLLQWAFVVGFPAHWQPMVSAILFLWPIFTILIVLLRLIPSVRAKAYLFGEGREREVSSGHVWDDAVALMSDRYISQARKKRGRWFGV